MRSRGFVAAAFAAAMVWPSAAAAQQVTGLTATHDVGFTTLKWAPVAGATDYQIERQSLDPVTDQPTGTATIVGLWQPTRTITPEIAGVRGVGLHSRQQLSVARAGAARHGQSAAVLGAGEGHDAGDPGPGRAC